MDKWPTSVMESGYDVVPKNFQEPKTEGKTIIPESGATPKEQVFDLQKQAVVDLIAEIVANADVVGHDTTGRTIYLLSLSPQGADTLAALFTDLEDGDPLDDGEEEHDGREPDPEDVR